MKRRVTLQVDFTDGNSEAEWGSLSYLIANINSVADLGTEARKSGTQSPAQYHQTIPASPVTLLERPIISTMGCPFSWIKASLYKKLSCWKKQGLLTHRDSARGCRLHSLKGRLRLEQYNMICRTNQAYKRENSFNEQQVRACAEAQPERRFHEHKTCLFITVFGLHGTMCTRNLYYFYYHQCYGQETHYGWNPGLI